MGAQGKAALTFESNQSQGSLAIIRNTNKKKTNKDYYNIYIYIYYMSYTRDI